ncbi:Aldehyde/histidinol dehydrogenase [Nemania sp. FL0031]|nr:Aldehyde/histidinol dehydrogenase [Nemania sp. FL0031]
MAKTLAVSLQPFHQRVTASTQGDPFDSNTLLGAQVSGAQNERIIGITEQAKMRGGTYVSLEVMIREVSGPIVAIAPFGSVGDVLRIANNSCYGLAAGVFTSDIKQGLPMAKSLEARTAWVDCYSVIAHFVPFRGCKDSSVG